MVIILGAGGFARELYKWGRHLFTDMLFFDNTTKDRKTLPPMTISEIHDYSFRFSADYLLGVGSPGPKVTLQQLAEKKGLVACSLMWDSFNVSGNTFGVGTIICPGTIITTNCVIDSFATINLNCTIGHDTKIGEFSTIAPGCNISGNVTIGKRVSIGTGAMIREGVTIGDDAVIGMGAVVLKDVPEGETWVGNPAKPLMIRDIIISENGNT
jgi:sugar O-acyltransferase (sialic acid O-acetyltransferase NeuD family)